MKLAGVVILFNPTGDVIKNIFSYKYPLQKLYVIDNSENLNYKLQKLLNNHRDIIYIHDGINEGISKRLNEAAEIAIMEGFDWMLTMDQDSYFDKETLSEYLQSINKYKGSEVAMFGIEHENNKTSNFDETFKNTHLLITSGSVLNLSLYNKIGEFDENLFIDHVDHEYCLRAILKGYKVVKWNKSFLYHSIGEKSYHRSFKNLKFSKRSLHSPIRLYYMVRNYFYIESLYKKYFKKELAVLRDGLINELKNNMLYSRNRSTIIKYILKGFFDFKKGNMGKISLKV